MIRLCLASALCLGAFAVAAPIPPGAGVPFGHDGLVSRADLEKVTFDSRLVLDHDEKPRDDDEEKDAPELVRKADGVRANRYDVAIHLPRTKVQTGDPLPVYLVLRNNRNETLGLHSSINLSGAWPELHGGGISFDVRDRATGKSVLGGLSTATNCGGGSLVDVPPRGFYCVRGDITRLCGALKPGEYEVDWRCGRFRSAAMTFTVTPSDAMPPKVAREKPSRLGFYRLTPGSESDQFRWTDAHLEPTRSDSMVAALAVGQAGPFVPDVRTIPSADKLIEASAVWKPYRDGDRVVLTLRSAAPGTEVRFRELPHLFLQVETPSSERDWWSEPAAAMKDKRADDRDLVTPIQIEARLPDGWRERLGPADAAKVSVLIASKEIEFPRGAGARIEKQADRVVERKSGRERGEPWMGVLRTAAIELRLPPRFPR